MLAALEPGLVSESWQSGEGSRGAFQARGPARAEGSEERRHPGYEKKGS